PTARPHLLLHSSTPRHTAREHHEWKWADARPLSDLRGRLHGGAVFAARPQVVPQHGRARETRVLRQHNLPPSDQRLHGAGGRPHGDGAG
ncbi:unnamed protein product, partial [Ectocarpus fasciculatus]